ncbi:tyrosine--tRNA ligase [Candidatus Roizmanbacteria bacterium RIFCSPLOWO2_01_FULL_41_22]|uniref:tyrosine--tRNA ligase n=2 Tax=Candidatus Roizmaniibacteriota TaxID=1752723 RepID=A0A1F7J959_9BACT|nr:MAG: tyrosine--tRNA ligase [Candidatus Roizmanbacteria bacterium RIFCSPLOWO2_01_FULL_41_22]
MTTEERLSLIKQVGEEIVGEDELKALLESGEQLIAYDGFEPSGQIHIAQGLLRAININKMTTAGIKFRMWVADWHAMANNKMGGDLEKIKTVGKYFIEVWKASGLDMSKVEFLWASEMAKNPDYWKLVVQVGRTNVLKRFIRTAEMMGREESLDKLTAANIIYSCMQIADIFMLKAKITQLGMDQRKVNMLAREIGPQLGFWKPVVVSHHMLMGLQKVKSQKSKVKNEENAEEKIKQVIALKMSKSLPDNAIFMTDTSEDVKRKITKAYCPEGEVKENPVLEYYRYILFEKFPQIILERPAKYGGAVILNSYQNLERLYGEKKIHPLDIKQTAVVLLDKLLQPVREHFTKNAAARELLTKVKSFAVTR